MTRSRSGRIRVWFLGALTMTGWIALATLRASGSASCIECHSDPDLTIERAGKTVSLQVDAQIFSHGPHQGFACDDCHSGLDPNAFPHANPIPKVDCRACHMQVGETHQFHALIGFDPTAQTPATDCVQCHGSHVITAIKAPESIYTVPRQAESCGQCHSSQSEEYAHSAHSRALAQFGPSIAPTCLSCHNTAAMGVITDPLERKSAVVNMCNECHRDNPDVAGKTLFGTPFITAFENSVHGRALVAGNPDAPSCTDCHGSHSMDRAIATDSLVSRQRVAETCASCHPKAAEDLHGSAHGVALGRGNRDAPTCTDCHGEHNILARSDPTARISARNLAQQVCGECHGSVRLTERYGIRGDTFDTFADSYHGLAGRGGSVSVVNCASCHGYHDVRNSSDPKSLVHRDNLAATCGTCHPGANERFAMGRVHVALDRTSEEPILFWIATIYVWLIILTIGAMLFHNLLDYFYKVRAKAKAHWGEVPHIRGQVPHRMHVRLTLNERLQHGLLASSFIILVITGFMLRYPEAWWVEILRGISNNLFEWRSLLHRIAGVVMVFAGIWHVIYVLFTERGRQVLKDITPRWHDVTDAIGTIRYHLGLTKDRPLFRRFSYIEKVEYWAMMWGSILMAVTGFLLWFDNFTMGLFTKLGFDIFRIIHLYEAILATLAIIVWHFYFTIFNPAVYPMNMAWLTGKMSEDEMLHEHPLELKEIIEKLEADKANQAGGEGAAPSEQSDRE